MPIKKEKLSVVYDFIFDGNSDVNLAQFAIYIYIYIYISIYIYIYIYI